MSRCGYRMGNVRVETSVQREGFKRQMRSAWRKRAGARSRLKPAPQVTASRPRSRLAV